MPMLYTHLFDNQSAKAMPNQNDASLNLLQDAFSTLVVWTKQKNARFLPESLAAERRQSLSTTC